ncbi:MAG: hypothetical protein JWM76_2235, partial [Pseudonocardiales bacterium]|nr:hypothetical protein [Pseudonocardiales bacterium]
MGSTTEYYSGWITASTDGSWPEDSWPEESGPDAGSRRALEAGLPAPPFGRIWLLRSPWPQIPVGLTYGILWSQLARASSNDEITQIYQVARSVMTWGEHRALDALTPETRTLLQAWAVHGRTGEQASAVLERRVSPAELDELMSIDGVDEQTALSWLDSLGRDADTESIDFIRSWRAAGSPGNPPPGAS